MADSAADCKATMDEMAKYIDRLYFTSSGGTYGYLATQPGFPIWIKNECSAVHDRDRALGQYKCSFLNPHGVVSGAPYAPGWIGSAVENAANNQFDLGLEQGFNYDWKGCPGRATRTCTATQIVYTIENIDEDFDIAPGCLVSGDDVDVYLGGTKVIDNLENLDPDDWSAFVTKTKADQNFLRSMQYNPRHGFGLGRVIFDMRGESTKADAMKASEGSRKDLYHLFYGSLSNGYDDQFQFYLSTWHDLDAVMSGDCVSGQTYVFGVADDGCYFYPHESKARAKILATIPVKRFFMNLCRGTEPFRMQWALHMLKKYQDPYRKFNDPALGVWPGYPNTSSPIEIADTACAIWDANSGLGFPPVSGSSLYQPIYGKANGFTTPQFAIFMTILGYGLGLAQYQSYADDAITQIRKATWGCSPQNSDGKGWIGGTEYTRPDHKGGVLNMWYEADSKLQSAEKGDLDKMFDKLTLYDTEFPVGIPNGMGFRVGNWDGLNQTMEDPCSIPTIIESTTLGYMALRIYLAYKYNEAYPAGTWANGLDLLSGYVSGKVTVDSVAVEDADVILIEGSTDVNPQALTSYVAKMKTDSDGAWSLPFEKTGNHTVYVVKSGYEHLRKVYNIGALDQNIFFPEAQLEAL